MSDDQVISNEINSLKQKVVDSQLPQELTDKINQLIHRLERAANHDHYWQEYEHTSHYINWVTAIPWGKRTPDRIDLDQAKAILDQNHYGLQEVKQRILEFLAVIKLNQEQNKKEVYAHAPVLCLVGLAGTGKTTFAYALAEAMNRKFARIPFGGMGSARDLRGQSRLHPEAEPGYLVKALQSAGSINPVILLDELDRVAEEARADIMGVLLELLDPGQNQRYTDHYIDFPINLNEVLFIGTANNTDNISAAVQNRLEIIHMPTYSDDEKIIIATRYLLPEALQEAGLDPNAIQIDDSVWPAVVRPLGFDSGIRMLKRTIDNLTRRIAFKVAKGEVNQIHITDQNLRDYFEQTYF